MQQILNAIQKEIDFQIATSENTHYNKLIEFDYGTLTIDIDIDERTEQISEPNHTEYTKYYRIEIMDLNVINESSKYLKNVSEKVMNEVELIYTNY